MLNRRFVIATIAMLATLMLAGPALAQQTKTFAVLPFSYNGPDKYKYFPKAFQASLNNDLEWTGHVVPASDFLVEGITNPKGKGDALNQIKGAGTDYLITGAITILDKEATLSMKAFGADGSYWENKGQMPIDEITPWLDSQSKAIMGDVFNRPGYSTVKEETKSDIVKSPAASGPMNNEFISATDDGYKADTLNPQFRYEGGSQNIGRWRSQTLRFNSSSMIVADGDGDGQNEIFILQRSGVSAYRFSQGKLKHLDTMDLGSTSTHLRLEAVDLDKDSIPEFTVASYQMIYRNENLAPEGLVRSHILSFKGGKFRFVVKNYGKFLGVLRMPPSYQPVLVTQNKGSRHMLARTIKEAYLKGDSIETGNNISAPEYGNIFNMVYLPDELGYKYVVIDDFHRLKVYSQTKERLSSSGEDTYNSSGLGIETSDRPVGMGPGTVDSQTSTYNVPFRMVTAMLGNNKKYELLVNKDLSYSARVFERFTYYSQGEIHALAWDGVGLNLAWKTRRIKGQVSDIAVADLNNDGKKQLCVLLNTFPGGLGFSSRKTVVLAYDLNM